MAQRSLTSTLIVVVLSLLAAPPAYSKTVTVISEVNLSNLKYNSVTITWRTDKPAICRVQYGETTSYGNTTRDSGRLTTRHQLTIRHLKQLTGYHYRIIARDRRGVNARSEDFTFTTTEARSSRDSTRTGSLTVYPTTPASTTLAQTPTEEAVVSATQAAEASQASQTLSISITPDAWNIGEVEVGTITTMKEAEKVTVANNGDGREDFTLALVNPDVWAADSQPGEERFVLNAAFSQFPDNIRWDVNNHLVTTEPVLSTEARFTGDQNGAGVSPGETRSLYLQFKSPTRTKITDHESIGLIISCEVTKN